MPKGGEIGRWYYHVVVGSTTLGVMPETAAQATDQAEPVKPKGATPPPAEDPDPTPTLDDIRRSITTQLDEARRALAEHRQIRDLANRKVAEALTAVEELERIHRNLNPTPRKRKTASSR